VVPAITFFLTYGADLPVARNILGPGASPEQVADLENRLGLNEPIVPHFWEWLSDVAHGDLGTSYFTSEPVTDALRVRLPVTLSVVLLASLIVILLSVALGVTAATRGGFVDGFLQSFSTSVFVFPGIVLAIAMVYLFSVVLNWLPAIGYVPLAESPSGWFRSILLPAIVLAIPGVASLGSQVRGSLIDQLDRDYVRTLRTRGVSERSIVLKHALRNAAAPALTVFSLDFISMFGGALFIEKIFALPGLGTYGYTSAIQGDLPAMLGVAIFGVGLVVVVNLVVDLINGWLNPKARVQ
jgi:peptide/nickel transport system permease protein